MLRNLFEEFDKSCEENNIYKLYTIGDCYVAMGFIDSNNRNPIEELKRMINLAFSFV
jgi:hypothetical protein